MSTIYIGGGGTPLFRFLHNTYMLPNIIIGNMPRRADAIGEKWDAATRAAIPDAKSAYGNALPGLPAKIIAKKSAAKSAYSAALDSPSYDASVRSGLAPGVADVAFNERMDQIATTGFTASQKQKLVEDTRVRRHLATLIPTIIAGADGASGNLTFPAGLSARIKRTIINVALMKLIDNFTTSTTATQAVNIMKSNVANLDDLTVS